MSDLASGLYGALLGAIVAAVATLIVARWQLKQMSDHHSKSIEVLSSQHAQSLSFIVKHHEETMAEQSRLLEATFAQQLLLQANEQKIRQQLDFLRKIDSVLDGSVKETISKGSDLSSSVIEKIEYYGTAKFSAELVLFRDNASLAIREFATVLNEYGHLESLRKSFDLSLKFQSVFFEPISILVNTLERMSSIPSREVLELMRDKTNAFSQAVAAYVEWQSTCREIGRSAKASILDGVKH